MRCESDPMVVTKRPSWPSEIDLVVLDVNFESKYQPVFRLYLAKTEIYSDLAKV